ETARLDLRVASASDLGVCRERTSGCDGDRVHRACLVSATPVWRNVDRAFSRLCYEREALSRSVVSGDLQARKLEDASGLCGGVADLVFAVSQCWSGRSARVSAG